MTDTTPPSGTDPEPAALPDEATIPIPVSSWARPGAEPGLPSTGAVRAAGDGGPEGSPGVAAAAGDPTLTWTAVQEEATAVLTGDGPAAARTAPRRAPDPSPIAAPTPAAALVTKRRSDAGGTALIMLASVVAVAGIAFAAGRLTAPADAGGGARTTQGAGGRSAVPGASAAPGGTALPSLLGDDEGAAGAPGVGAGPGTAPGGGTAPDGRPDGFPADGFGRAGSGGMVISGTVTAVDGTRLTITLPNGTETVVTTTDTTTYHRQEAATASDLTAGAEVRVTLSGRFRREQGGASGGGATGGMPATDVTIQTP